LERPSSERTLCRQETVMPHRRKFSVKAVSLMIAAVAVAATVAPSGAFARSPHRAHAVMRTAPVDVQGPRAYGPGTSNAYGAMRGGSSSSGSASFGYGVGDNSHNCAACAS
jgi:hypothetical protein